MCNAEQWLNIISIIFRCEHRVKIFDHFPILRLQGLKRSGIGNSFQLSLKVAQNNKTNALIENSIFILGQISTRKSFPSYIAFLRNKQITLKIFIRKYYLF